jgi:uncharacterized SAM-binding protein YcdF (DUF218 family)
MFLPIKLAMRALGLVVLAIAIYLGATAVQIVLTSRQSSTETAQAVIVMGSAQYDGKPSPDLKARLKEALVLWRSKRAPMVAVTGGKMSGDRFTEAEVSAAWLEARGVPKSALLIGGGSDSYQNISSVAEPLKARGANKVLVVTDPFHEHRSMAIAGSFGLVAAPSPATSSPITGIATIPYFAKETLAVAVGRLIGYGTLSSTEHPAGG